MIIRGTEGDRALRVMGIDIEPGCGRRRCFSAVVLEDGRLSAKYESITLHRLIRLILEHKPDVLAVDNIYELAEDERELARLISLLPDNLEIIQVTRREDGTYVDLKKLAYNMGVDVGSGKLSPQKTAYLVALLAEKGVGSKVRFVENKTKIIVSKNRRLSSGGMSSNRYKRRIRSAILRAVKDIKKLLDRHRFDYDLIFRKSGGGLEGAVFIVYVNREKLYGIIKPYEDNDVRIEIRPVYSSRIIFEPLVHNNIPNNKRYLIVGVDPGIATGIAAVDLNGNVILVMSRKGIDRQDIVEIIRQHGTPVLVATDTKPAPEFARKLAGTLGVPLYEPPESLSVDEKRELVARYVRDWRIDSHSRDALAAALKAYNAYLAKMRQIEASMARLGIEVDVEKVKAEVIRGKTIAEAVENEIERLLSDDEGIVVKRIRRDYTEEKNDTIRAGSPSSLERLREEIEHLRAENMGLKRRLKELMEYVEQVKMDYELLMREIDSRVETDRTVQMLKHEINLLRHEIDKLSRERDLLLEKLGKAKKLFIAVLSGLMVPALRVSTITERSIKHLIAKEIAKIIVVDNVGSMTSDAVELLRKHNIFCVLVSKEGVDRVSKEIEAKGIPVLPLEDYIVDEIDDIVFLRPEIVMDAYQRLQKIREAQMQKVSSKSLISLDKLKKLLEEYRRERVKVLQGSIKEQDQF